MEWLSSYKQGNFISLPLVEGKQEVLIAAVVAPLHTLASHFLFSVVAPEQHFFLSAQVRGELDQDWHKKKLR